jgi:hypothetical protein
MTIEFNTRLLSMKRLLPIFLFFILFYHILHTLVVYGQGWMSVEIFSIIKEVSFLWLVGAIFLTGKNQLKIFFKTFKYPLIMIGVIFVVFLWVSRWNSIPWDSVMVGIKYDLRWLIILMGGVIISLKYKVESTKIDLEKYIVIILWIIILWWIVWQWGKVLFPEFFQRRGYGSIGDYVLWSHPPMRYRTGPGGWMRFSGIFSWPNNLAYMMVAFFPLVAGNILYPPRQQRTHPILKKYSIPLALAMIVTTVATLSRAAWGALVLEIALLLWVYRTSWRRYILYVTSIAFLLLLWLLQTKQGSTQEHASRFIEGLSVVQNAPFWLWLGMAGPSIHYHGVYLPENQYLQRGIDGWVLWLLCILVFIYFLLQQQRKQRYNNNDAFLMSIGFVWLLAIGVFLHSFEDSMVNYLFFLLFGISLGYSGLVKSKE